MCLTPSQPPANVSACGMVALLINRLLGTECSMLDGLITYYVSSCCCCCCSHINSHNQVRGHRTGSSHSGAEEYPRKKTHNPRWYTHISQLTQFMPPPETYKSEIGSQSTMCQVQAGAYTLHYSRLEKPNIPIATQGRLPRIYYT